MSSGVVRARIEKNVAVIWIDRPPVNALGRDLRQALSDAILELQDTAGVSALVLAAEGRIFSAGADIREFDQTGDAPDLGALCTMIENCPKPVVAAVQGAALGGGAEIVFAAHYRIGTTAATIGLPEVGLGLLPGAGGTQRLPRLIGPAVALEMMMSGRPLNDAAAHKLGLFDQVVEGDVVQAAQRFARDVIEKGDGPRPTSADRSHLLDGRRFMAVVAEARRKGRGSHAESQIVSCVEAALLLPFDAALEFEREAFRACLGHSDSKALRHIFMAERSCPETLLGPSRDGRRQLTPAGGEVIDQLYAAQDQAVVELFQAGHTEAAIDGAMIELGFEHGPFGGETRRRSDSNADIQRRIIAALAAEGSRIVESGAASKAADIDALSVHGMGFPRSKGGPMKAAHLIGLLGLTRQMADWAAQDPVWQVPNLMTEAARYADGFDALP